MEIFNGNSVPISISAKYKDGSQYVFKENDIVKLGIKRYVGATKYDYKKEKTIAESVTTVLFNLEAEEMKKLNGKYVIEAELVYNKGQDISTLFQEELNVKGVVIDE